MKAGLWEFPLCILLPCDKWKLNHNNVAPSGRQVNYHFPPTAKWFTVYTRKTPASLSPLAPVFIERISNCWQDTEYVGSQDLATRELRSELTVGCREPFCKFVCKNFLLFLYRHNFIPVEKSPAAKYTFILTD